jgi:hypothetical protein
MEAATAEQTAILDHKYVGDITGRFFVAGYQRGYRWDTTDVKRLLDDIWHALDNNSSKQPYNLQPVVVKLRQPGSTEQPCLWELVDGQQRLTTLYLILLYMRNAGLNRVDLPYELHYETRPGSADFLERLANDDQPDHDRNIDYYHLFEAYKYIGEWFEAHGNRTQYAANRFYAALFETVRVIWYQAPAHMEATALFTRLNVGKIPLTDAELVKALLLSKVKSEHPHRAAEVASQWDIIERDLHTPELWGFISSDTSGSADDRYPTRISLLLDTLAPSLSQFGRRPPRYHTFESLRSQIEHKPMAFWMQVLNLHDLMLGWFNNRSLYHKVGYLVLTGIAFGQLARLAQDQSKSKFEYQLDQRIKKVLDLRASDVEMLSYDNQRDYQKLMRLLLLMNVESMRVVPHSNQRFPFHLHTDTAWSLEHIHAQNAESLTKAEQWRTWLQQHLNALRAQALETDDEQGQLIQDIQAALVQIEIAKNFGATFQALAARVVKVFDAPSELGASAAQNVHSISNLALLSKADNSLLSNSVFEVKRQNLLAVDRKGGYLPICTRNVFLKYYTMAEAHQNHFWSPQDRHQYLEAIISTVQPYLLTEEHMA